MIFLSLIRWAWFDEDVGCDGDDSSRGENRVSSGQGLRGQHCPKDGDGFVPCRAWIDDNLVGKPLHFLESKSLNSTIPSTMGTKLKCRLH